ncbi:hypothetical protein [Actinoplanes sp. NPDC051851]|uniref:hypothetical protein n=1 Tax=Actinoplanes sp. NPDC051851 TaxID=3154753 RepID=UPI00341E84A2
MSEDSPSEADQLVTFAVGTRPPSAISRPTLPIPAGPPAPEAETEPEAEAAPESAADDSPELLETPYLVSDKDPAEPAEPHEPTSEWPEPLATYVEEDTDPAGFPPAGEHVYPPATDPYDDPAFTSAYPMPGWTAPPDAEPLPTERQPRRRPLLALAATVGLAGLIGAFLLVPRQSPATDPAAADATSTTAPASQDDADGDEADGDGAGADGDGAGDNGADAGGDAAAGGALTGTVDGLSDATFHLVDGATKVHLSAADLGDGLYRISTASGSGLTPSVDRDGGDVSLHLASDDSGGNATVEIVLSTAVRWTLSMEGGSASSELDLSGADVESVALTGGASRIALTLPDQNGLIPVTMTGGVDQFVVTLPDSTPVRVRVGSGAGEVTLDGATHKGIAPGQSFTANGFDGDAGIDLDAAAGMSTLTVSDQ